MKGRLWGVASVLMCSTVLAGCSDFPGPDAGKWFYAETSFVQNECGPQAEQAVRSGGEFEILADTDSSFIVDPKDGTPPFTCQVNGMDFTCPRRAVGLVSQGDSTVRWQVEAKGTFSSERRATGRQEGLVECEGSACPLIAGSFGASFPCRIAADFVIVAR